MKRNNLNMTSIMNYAKGKKMAAARGSQVR
jgi:hypothetical protein